MRVALSLALLFLVGVFHAVLGAEITQGVSWNHYGVAQSELMQEYNSFLESRAHSRRSALREKVSNQGYLTTHNVKDSKKVEPKGTQPAPASAAKASNANVKAKNVKATTTTNTKNANAKVDTNVKATAKAATAKAAPAAAAKAPAAKATKASSAPLDLSREFPQLDIFATDPNSPLDISLLPPDLRYPLEMLPPLTKCPVPSKLRVRQEPFNSKKDLVRSVLQGILGEAPEFAKRESTVEGQSFSCVDSRKQGAILGTPGGDFGEFLVALSVMEEMRKKNFNDQEVVDLLSKWVTWDRKGNYALFHHTDEAAVRHLAKGLHVNGMAGVVTDLDIRNPPVELRAEILLSLNQTENQGSHVIKAFLNYPDRFLIRRELTGALLRAFYTLLWDRTTRMPAPEPDVLTPATTLAKKYGAKDTERPEFVYQRLNLEIYRGEPASRAWISVRSSSSCEVLGAAHKFSPRNPVPLKLFPKDSAEAKQAAKIQSQAATAATKEAEADKKKAAQVAARTKALLESSPAAQAIGGLDHEAFAALGVENVDIESLFGSNPIMLETSVEVSEASADEAMVVTEVFVHHPHAVTVQRKWLSRFFALMFPEVGRQPIIYKQILRRQVAVTELIAEMLGRNTPFYTVTVE